MSVRVEFSARDRRRFNNDLKKWRKDLGLTREQALDTVALDIRTDAQKNLDQNGTTDRGLLKNSITISKTISKGRRVGTETGYGLYVEFGRPPGKQPPPKVLQRWVRQKLGIRGKMNKGVAFMIGKAIAQRGTKAQPFLVPAYEKNKLKIINEVRKKYKRNA